MAPAFFSFSFYFYFLTGRRKVGGLDNESKRSVYSIVRVDVFIEILL